MKRKLLKLKYILIINVILLFFFTSACGYKEVDNRFFATSIAVDQSDKSEKLLKISLKLAVPQSELKMGGEKFVVVNQEAPTITEAVRLIKSKLDKELDFAHNKIIIFGEEFVKKRDVVESLDWFIRRRDIQKIAWVSIGKPDALTILKFRPGFERLPSYALILTFSRTGTVTSYVTSEYLFDFAKRLKERGIDPVLPIIEREKDFFSINKSAIFDKNSMKLSLNSEETKMLNFLVQEISATEIKVRTKDFSFSIAVDQVKSKISIEKKKGAQIILGVNVKVEGIVEETTQTLVGGGLKQYERLAEKQLQKEFTKLLTKLQKNNLDPVGFGLLYRSRNLNNGEDWKEWQRLYPEAQFDIHMKVKITGTGIIK